MPTASPTPVPMPAPAFDGIYVLEVDQPTGGFFPDSTLTFKIGSLDANEAATWRSGDCEQLNLTATTQGRTAIPTPGAVLTSLTSGTLAQKTPPQVFVGTAIVDGVLVPEGTLVTVWIEGVRLPGAEAMVLPRPSLSTPPASGSLKPLGNNLVRVFGFNNATKRWAFYDPSFPCAAMNTLTKLILRQAYFIKVEKDQTVVLNGRERNLSAGWNVIPW